jgi:hypothetical protein
MGRKVNGTAESARYGILGTIAILVAASDAAAGVQTFFNYSAWSSEIGGSDQKLDFNFGSKVQLSDQYAEYGVSFAPGASFTSTSLQSEDGWELESIFVTGNTVPIDYTVDQWAFGVEILSKTNYAFYKGDSLIFNSGLIIGTAPLFRGWVFDQPFDKVVVTGSAPSASVRIDSLYVATPVPGASGAFVIAMGFGSRRRRKC